jgi:hypothetical protein
MRSAAGFWGVTILLALASVGCSSDADEHEGVSPDNIEYLAVGDSIAYGENLFVPDTKKARPNGDAFVGYPDLIGPEIFGGHYANLGCPGATTASYLSLDGVDNGCRDFQEQWLDTLHVPYTGTQADKATEILRANKVKVVTVGLGGNDLLHALSECTAVTPDDPDAAFSCAVAALPQVIKDGVTNLEEIVKRIRQDFDGELIYVNVYSTYATSDPATLAISAWNDNAGAPFEDSDGEVADVFTAFKAEAEKSDGDPCAAGLLIPNPVEGETPPCDIHPSESGARLLADTVEALPGFKP